MVWVKSLCQTADVINIFKTKRGMACGLLKKIQRSFKRKDPHQESGIKAMFPQAARILCKNLVSADSAVVGPGGSCHTVQ